MSRRIFMVGRIIRYKYLFSPTIFSFKPFLQLHIGYEQNQNLILILYTKIIKYLIKKKHKSFEEIFEKWKKSYLSFHLKTQNFLKTAGNLILTPLFKNFYQKHQRHWEKYANVKIVKNLLKKQSDCSITVRMLTRSFSLLYRTCENLTNG